MFGRCQWASSQVLSRELRENAKRSYELAVAITGGGRGIWGGWTKAAFEDPARFSVPTRAAAQEMPQLSRYFSDPCELLLLPPRPQTTPVWGSDHAHSGAVASGATGSSSTICFDRVRTATLLEV